MSYKIMTVPAFRCQLRMPTECTFLSTVNPASPR